MGQPQQPPLQPDGPKKETGWTNAIASFMSRRIRHVHANRDEWYRVHRSSGNGSPSGGPWWLYVIIVIAALVVIGAVINWIVQLIATILPYIIGIGIVLAILACLAAS